MSTVPQTIFRFSTITIKIQAVFAEIGEPIPLLHMEMLRDPEQPKQSGKRKRSWKTRIIQCQMSYKAIAFKSVQYQTSPVGQWLRLCLLMQQRRV